MENIRNEEEGYVTLEDSNNHRISMPTTLMDVCHHFEDVPRTARHNRVINTTVEEDMPRNLLHDVALNSHLQRPTIRI